MGSSRPSINYSSVNKRWEVRGKGGALITTFGDDGRKTVQTFVVNAFNTVGWGSDAKWSPVREGIYMEEYYSSKECWVPLPFLQVGDAIVSYKVIGELRGGTSVFDCALYRVVNADPITKTDIGAISQNTTEGVMGSEKVLDAEEIVTASRSYLLEFSGTNAGWTDWIYVQSVEVKVRRQL